MPMDLAFDHPLFNNYPDPVFSLDLQGNFTSVNKALIQLAECRSEEMLGNSFTRFVDPEHLQTVYEFFHKSTEGEIQRFEADVISAKGTPRTLSITNIPIVRGGVVEGVYAIAQDITEVKKTARKLEDYHHQISTIMESITDAFYAVDRNWTITYWNREAARLLGRDKDEVIGKNLWEEFREALPLKFYKEYSKTLIDNIPRRFEEFFPPVDAWFEVNVYPSADGLSVYFKNVTKRKLHEQQIRVEKERYQKLFDLSPLPQWVYDLETLRFLDVNRAAVRHYGYSREEFLSMTIKDIRASAQIKELDYILKSQEQDGFFHSNVVKHLKRSGEEIIVTVESNPLDYEGQPARLVLAIDETEKVLNKLKMQESIDRFNIVSEATSDAIWDWDLVKGTVTWNNGITTIFGHRNSSYAQEWWYEQIHPDDLEKEVEKLDFLIAKKQSKLLTEFRFKCADGSYKHVLDRAFLVFNEDGQPVRMIGSMQDISERIKYIRSIEDQNRKMHEIAWIQSHVVRAPLSRIMGLSRLINDPKTDDDMRKELLEHLDTSAQEFDTIIREIVVKSEGIQFESGDNKVALQSPAE